MICNDSYDIAFVDYRLGAKSGVDFLKEVRDSKLDTPIVLLTGQGNYQVDLEAMQLGAVDYLIKAELTAEKTERCLRYSIDRAATLRALKESELKYRSIFEKSKDIIFVANESGIISDINVAVTQTLGHSTADMIGSDITKYITKEVDKEYVTDAIFKRNAISDYTLAFNKLDGSKLYAAMTLSWNETVKGGVLQGIIHDLTNLKKAEKALLNNEKLAATSRLVRTLAHEVRNPLNNISMSADQLLRDITLEEHPLYLDIIRRNSIRINNLITDLLHAHLPSDNARKKSYLQDIVAQVLSGATDRLMLKKMFLETAIYEQPLPVIADVENLKIALLNILINAIEAMNDGEGVLKVSVDVVGGNPVVTISDNGCGISEEHINHIFEPYYTRKKGGTGLGLSFTHSIVKSHNATMEVSSVKDKGTTFIITFPRLEY